MTQNECLAKAGVAYGVIEDDGTTHWTTNWFEAELSRYKVIKTPEAQADLKAKRLGALAKARQVRADKKAEIARKKVDQCPGGCGYTVAMCACPPVPLCEVDKVLIQQPQEAVTAQ
jgi:hypothetical protein